MAYLAKNPYALALTAFSRTEAQHALRMCAFRGDISERHLTQALMTFERDQDEGFYESFELDGESLFQMTAQLSHRHALSHGTRYLDMMHVASALLVKGRRFLTFDERQGRLAGSTGLEVKP